MKNVKKYLICFLVSMVPIVELRGAIPISQGMQLPLLQSYIICVIGNMLRFRLYIFLQDVFLNGVQTRNISESSLHFVLKRVTKVEKS